MNTSIQIESNHGKNERQFHTKVCRNLSDCKISFDFCRRGAFFGIGNPLLDVSKEVDEDFLEK